MQRKIIECGELKVFELSSLNSEDKNLQLSNINLPKDSKEYVLAKNRMKKYLINIVNKNKVYYEIFTIDETSPCGFNKYVIKEVLEEEEAIDIVNKGGKKFMPGYIKTFPDGQKIEFEEYYSNNLHYRMRYVDYRDFYPKKTWLDF